ncbi:transporter [Stenotrophomonas nematodicola]|uniref:Transporter n=1 Tax=Stenotrophomonas nematodicola TaxID=2656746 RepID=A0ABW7CXM3_9GAMM
MRLTTTLALLLLASPALAQDGGEETPAFDRPGIGFSPSTLPRGSVALEWGLPSVERDRDEDGTRSTQYSSDLNLRIGVAEHVELQVFSTPWNHLQVDPRGARSRSVNGAGDSGLALKIALPSSSDRHAFALLASSSFATGARDFSEGGTQYALGASYEYTFDDRWSGALYANATRGAGEDSFTWSPSLSVALSDRVSSYIEAGFTHTDGEPSTAIAGAGLTWMVARTVQLDASFDVGLDHDSPDLQAGLGVSFFFQ